MIQRFMFKEDFVKTYNVAIRGPVHEIPFDCDVSVVAGERSCR